MYTRSLLWAGAGVLLLAANGSAAEVGALAGPFPRAGGAAPLQVSTRYVLEGVDLAKGVQLPLTGGVAHLAVLSPGHVVREVRLRDAAGQDVATNARAAGGRFHEPELLAFDLPPHGLGMRIDGAQAGTYSLRGDAGGGEVAVVVNEEGSPLELSLVATPLAARSGEPVNVEARLLSGGEPVLGAQVVARVMEWERPRAVLRLDEVEPGRYVGTLSAHPEQGLQPLSIRVDARGELADGTRFLRTALTGAMVAPGIADLDLAGLRLDAATLAVPVVGAAGDYRLEAIFGAALGEELVSLAFAREDFQLHGGRLEVALPVPAEASGARHLTLRLLDRTSLAVEREVEVPVMVEGPARPVEPAQEALPATKKRAARTAQ